MANELKIYNGLITPTVTTTGASTLDSLTVTNDLAVNGNTTLGNATNDNITATGRLASDLVPSTTNTRNLGTADLGYASVYLGTADTDTAKLVSAALTADRIYTFPDAGADANVVLSEGTATVNGDKTFGGDITFSGLASFNNNVTFGNATTDTITLTSRFVSDIIPSTTNTRALGTADLGFSAIYLGTGDADTAKVVTAEQSADRIFTIPAVSGNADFVMTGASQSIGGTKTFTEGMVIDGTADEIQLRVQGNGTQTSAYFVIEQSDGTDLVNVASTGIANFVSGIKLNSGNTLSIYEEGTWTPTVAGSTTAGTHGYSVQVGSYTRIGRVVYIQCYVKINEAADSAAGGAASVGQVKIAGLPYTSNSTTNYRFQITTDWSDINSTAGFTSIVGEIPPSQTAVFLYELGDNTARSTLPVANWDTLDCFIRLSGFYFV